MPKNLTNAQQYQQVFNLPALDIQEGGQGENIDYIDFTQDKGKLEASGRYALINGELEFNVLYQLKDELFDIEHVRENGEEFICIDCPDGWTSSIYLKNGVQQKIVLSEHPTKKHKKSFELSLISGLAFFELTKT